MGVGGFFNAQRLSKKPSLTHLPLYVTFPTVRVLMLLILLFLEFLIALKALDGSLDTMALKVIFVLYWRDLIRSLDNFLLSL